MANNPFNFSKGGESWSGWTFGPYGKAREWRIFAPTGEMFTASEILGMRANALDVDYLQGKARRLESEKAELERKLAQQFTPEEFEMLRAAVAIISSRIEGMEKHKPVARAPVVPASACDVGPSVPEKHRAQPTIERVTDVARVHIGALIFGRMSYWGSRDALLSSGIVTAEMIPEPELRGRRIKYRNQPPGLGRPTLCNKKDWEWIVSRVRGARDWPKGLPRFCVAFSEDYLRRMDALPPKKPKDDEWDDDDLPPCRPRPLQPLIA